jgi:hypothetical protein
LRTLLKTFLRGTAHKKIEYAQSISKKAFFLLSSSAQITPYTPWRCGYAKPPTENSIEIAKIKHANTQK